MDRNSLAPGHTFLAPYYFFWISRYMWKLHHSKTYDELRYNFFGLFLDVQRFFQDFPWDFPLDQTAQLRSRWRVALGGAQLDPAMRVAELSVEDLVKLCNALERLRGTLKSGAFSVFFFRDDPRFVWFFWRFFGKLDQMEDFNTGIVVSCESIEVFLLFLSVKG